MKKILITLVVLGITLGLAGHGNFALWADSESAAAAFAAGTWEDADAQIEILAGSLIEKKGESARNTLVMVFSNDRFDAALIDVDTVKFGTSGTAPLRWAVCDLNDDNYLDVIFEFVYDPSASPGTNLVIMGKTGSGSRFQGHNSVGSISCQDIDFSQLGPIYARESQTFTVPDKEG